MDLEIRDKVVAITGASSGMGRSTAILLAKHGAKVVLGSRRAEQLEEVVNIINAEGGQAVYAITDVTKMSDLENLVELARETFGRLDVIVNNAGVSALSRFDELDASGWEEMIDVNFKGLMYGMAAAIPMFKKQQSGQIINILSTAGIRIVPTMGVYAASKNAARTLTEAFRQESDGSIRITGISPGFVNTNLPSTIKDPEVRKSIMATADKIAISPDDIARSVAFVIGQPADVEIGDLVIRPSVQN